MQVQQFTNYPVSRYYYMPAVHFPILVYGDRLGLEAKKDQNKY